MDNEDCHCYNYLVRQNFKNIFQTLLLVIFFIGLFILFQSISAEDRDVPVLECQGVKIQMPKKWNELTPSKNKQLDSNGCHITDTTCLCVKHDPDSHSTKGVVFSVLVTSYPVGLTLDSLVANTKSVSEVNKFDFLGYPAVRFKVIGENEMITTAFIKDQKLYQFDFGASENAINNLWPDMDVALHEIKFQ